WRNPWFRFGAVLALIALVTVPFAISWVVHRFTHSITDDAFVEAHIVNLSPQKVAGHLVRDLVQEHDVGRTGQLVVGIDPVPYREQVALQEAKLQVAKAQLAAEETNLEVLRAQVPKEIEVARKTLAAAKAEQARDEENLKYITDDVDKSIQQAKAVVEA